MKLPRVQLLHIAVISVVNLPIVGGMQQRNFAAEAQTPRIMQTQNQIQNPTPAAPIPPQRRIGEVPFVPTPQPVVNAMLELAKVNSNDVLYDLGSGDGRIPITAAQKYNVRRATGIEINPELVRRSQVNAQQANVGDRVQFYQQDLFDNALITGASSGIGQAIAIRLAQEGVNIAINYRSSPEGAEETEEIAMQKACGDIENCGVKSLLVQGDVSKEADIIRMVDSAVDKFGSLDILINNAGIQTESPRNQ